MVVAGRLGIASLPAKLRKSVTRPNTLSHRTTASSVPARATKKCLPRLHGGRWRGGQASSAGHQGGGP